MTLVCWALVAAALVSVGAEVRDLVVFDEDDSIGRDYYDASIGSFQASRLRLGATSRNKLPVSSARSKRGKDSAILEWISRRGGDWRMHVYRPGFPVMNLTHYRSLVVWVNGPAAIPRDALPEITLGDPSAKSVSLGRHLPKGLDGDPETWEKVEIPLNEFAMAGQTDFPSVKNVIFKQSGPDATPRTLWIDDLRFIPKVEAGLIAPPGAPVGLVARAGDRSVALHWKESVDADRYHVYRREGEGGTFEELTGSPVSITSIADLRVENDRKYFYGVKAANEAGGSTMSELIAARPSHFKDDDEFLELLQATAFDYFWFEANPNTGLVRDRSERWSAASIAATGFGLTAIGIGVDHDWITRVQGAERTVRTLRTLAEVREGPDARNTSGYKGWFYHFLEPETGLRYGTSELSSIDTALLLAGVLYARNYFDGDLDTEREIRALAQQIFDRIDWKWMLNSGETLSMGWFPERGFIKARWNGYNEASILYLLGLGANDSGALEPNHWKAWCSSYKWQTSYGFSFVHFPPLFGHQYSTCWIDFRAVQDEYMRVKGITYFENSRRATLAQQAYAIANPKKFSGYGENVWGLTACDGPGSNGAFSYIARGTPPAENDDGTIAPTAVGGSLPFAPDECIAALRFMYEQYREKIWCGYGFRDAFNLAQDWWDPAVIGIDQGPILLMAENLRSGKVWSIMMKSPEFAKGLKRAGFEPKRN